MPRVVAVIVFASISIISLSIAQDTSDNPSCEELGFTSNLLCSNCDLLHSHVGDATLTEECRSCCTKDVKEKALTIYSKGILEICPRALKLGVIPNIKDFIENKAESFGNRLQIRHRTGATTRLLLWKTEGEKEEPEVRVVHKWDVKDIDEFLRDRLLVSSDEDKQETREASDTTVDKGGDEEKKMMKEDVGGSPLRNDDEEDDFYEDDDENGMVELEGEELQALLEDLGLADYYLGDGDMMYYDAEYEDDMYYECSVAEDYFDHPKEYFDEQYFDGYDEYVFENGEEDDEDEYLGEEDEDEYLDEE